MSSHVKAIFEFWGESEAELSFQVGDVITVIKRDDAGWWEGELNGRKGLFPHNYVEECAPPASTAPIAKINSKPPGTPIVNYHPNQSPGTKVSGAPGGVSVPPVSIGVSATAAKNSALPENKPATFKPTGPPARAPTENTAAAASSSSASARPPSGEVRGGGGDPPAEKKVIRVSKTKFGLWSSNQAYYAGWVMIPMGLAAVLWHQADSDRHPDTYLACGIYTSLVGMAIVAYETFYGASRGESRFPARAIVYFGLSIFCFFSLPTVFPGTFLLVTAITNFVACMMMKEVYDAPEVRAAAQTAAESDLVPVDSFWEGLVAWATMIKQQNKQGAFLFMLAYVIGNVALFAWTVNHWVLKNRSISPYARLSEYAYWAKGFGSLLDLNCALIVLPVSRTLLRMLYNRSTADQGFISRSLRAILNFIPLDQNIAFHKVIAKVILLSAVGHVGFHFVNLAYAYDNTIAIFGESVWYTGGFIVLWMFFIYTATPDNTRRGQFEIFWYSHHCFVLFFVFILFHGEGGINPNYWKYAIPTMTIYITERVLRIYRASLPISVLSVSLMDDVLSLQFAKEGVFEHEYKEGQYLFLQAPSLSAIQWHPFTISSAPQEDSVTVHIRVCGEGSWTSGLMQYMSTLGPKGKTFIAFDRLGPAGTKIPGKLVGPDGRPLIRVDGPHSAPTQHIGEYRNVMIIGAGIGATPVSSTLKSVVFHKWRVNIGDCFPAHAYFMWVCAYRDIDAFRWLIRTIREAQDEVVHLRGQNSMSNKTFEFHIFLTSAPKNPKPITVVVDDEIGFWGPPRESSNLEKGRSQWSEIDLYKAMKCPAGHTQLGDVHVWEGRPRWGDRFKAVAAKHQDGDVGVTFCGNPMIARDLRKQCYLTNKTRSKEQGLFKLHKENF